LSEARKSLALPGVEKDLVLSRAENGLFFSGVRKNIWSGRDREKDVRLVGRRYLVMSEIGKSLGPIRAWKKFGHVGGQKKIRTCRRQRKVLVLSEARQSIGSVRERGNILFW
jgi:hypothetical protein